MGPDLARLFALAVLGRFEGGTEFQQAKDRRGFKAEETAQARCGDGVWNVFVVMDLEKWKLKIRWKGKLEPEPPKPLKGLNFNL